MALKESTEKYNLKKVQEPAEIPGASKTQAVTFREH